MGKLAPRLLAPLPRLAFDRARLGEPLAAGLLHRPA
jgi:hypothetical protein